MVEIIRDRDRVSAVAERHHACKMGLQGIVSKRENSTYHSGQNPNAPAVTREAEEDWSR
jgi:ATP-dependent DNA ligase